MLRACVHGLSRLPLRVHHALADGLLYPFIYHVARYRKAVVSKNIENSFPDKTEKERKAIERAFYHQFCDTIVEIIYGYSCSEEEMRQRVVFENIGEVNRLVEKAGGGIVMLAHMGNWEWIASAQQWLSPQITEMNIYRRLKNSAVDRLMLAIRAKRGGVCVEKQRVLREMVTYRAEKKNVLVCMLSDQKPRPEVTRTWIHFLHQETGFFDGGEMLAKKFNYPVFYVNIRRTQRGQYHCIVEVLAAEPNKTAEGEITKAYAKALETNILQQPEMWLWSHNRFRWKKQ